MLLVCSDTRFPTGLDRNRVSFLPSCQPPSFLNPLKYPTLAFSFSSLSTTIMFSLLAFALLLAASVHASVYASTPVFVPPLPLTQLAGHPTHPSLVLHGRSVLHSDMGRQRPGPPQHSNRPVSNRPLHWKLRMSPHPAPLPSFVLPVFPCR